MKKLLSILLAFVLVFSMVACTSGESAPDADVDVEEADEKDTAKDTEKDVEKNTEEEDRKAVEKTVISFMDAFVNLEFDKLADYCLDDAEIAKDLEGLDIAAAFESMMNELPAEFAPYSDDFEDMLDSLLKKIKADFSYEILEVEKENDEKYNVTVEYTMSDMESVDIENIIAGSITEDEVVNILMEMIDAGELSLTATEDEMLAAVMPIAVSRMVDAVESVEFEVLTDVLDFVVVKTDDGEWLIDAE